MLTGHQAEILEQVARGVPLHETLTTIARTVEDHFPRLACVLSLLSADGLTLQVGACPSLPAGFWEAIDDLPVGPLSLNDEVAVDLAWKILQATKSDLGPTSIDPRQEKLLARMGRRG